MKTIGNIKTMNLSKILETLVTPFSKLVCVFGAVCKVFAIAPNWVSSPTAMTTALALPLMTFVPINAIFLYPVVLSWCFVSSWLNFSMCSLSPVKEDSFTKSLYIQLFSHLQVTYHHLINEQHRLQQPLLKEFLLFLNQLFQHK